MNALVHTLSHTVYHIVLLPGYSETLIIPG